MDNTDPEGLWVPQNGEWSVNGGAMSDAASAFGQVQSDSLSSFSTYNSVVQQYLWQKTDYHDGDGPQLTGEWPIAPWMLGGGGGSISVITYHGFTPVEVQKIKHLIKVINTTKRGHELVSKALKSSHNYKIIKGNVKQAAGDSVTGGVLFNLNFSATINTEDGLALATPIRVLAHELGHAVGGQLDDGPGAMNNVNANENPIM